MKSFQESKTFQNLARAFAGECQAGARYQFMRKMATQQEELPYLGQMLKTLATNEMAHARTFYALLTEQNKTSYDNVVVDAGYPFPAGTLQELLAHAAQSEQNEALKIYPAFAQTADEEGFKDIAEVFRMTAQVEKQHHAVLQMLAKKLQQKKLYVSATAEERKCSLCGHTEKKKEAWKTCPLCGAVQGAVQIPQPTQQQKKKSSKEN